MKIYSEKTHKEYATVEECLEAEALFDKEREEAEKRKEELQKVKKERADEVMAAYRKIKEDEKEYIKLRNAFVSDYGYFHMSYHNEEEEAIPDIFSDIFSFFGLH